MTNETPSMMDDWLQWMRDFQTEVRSLVQELEAEPHDEANAELLTIQFAINARLLTLLDTAIRLASDDKLLDLRMTARSIIECGIHLEAAVNKSDYVALLKSDEKASKRSLVKSAAKDTPPLEADMRKLVQEFLNDKTGKRLQPTELGKESNFRRLISIYRQISSDASHVSISALRRHLTVGPEGIGRLIIDPSLEEGELYQSLSAIALTMMLCTKLMVEIVTTSAGSQELLELGKRYTALYQRDRQLELQTANDV